MAARCDITALFPAACATPTVSGISLRVPIWLGLTRIARFDDEDAAGMEALCRVFVEMGWTQAQAMDCAQPAAAGGAAGTSP